MRVFNADIMRPKVAQFVGNDVLCLAALAQPLVTEMQQVIRFQEEQKREAAKSLHYLLLRIARDERVQNVLGAGTESYEQLTATYADLTGRNVDEVRDGFIPGSAAIHRRDEEEWETERS